VREASQAATSAPAPSSSTFLEGELGVYAPRLLYKGQYGVLKSGCFGPWSRALSKRLRVGRLVGQSGMMMTVIILFVRICAQTDTSCTKNYLSRNLAFQAEYMQSSPVIC